MARLGRARALLMSSAIASLALLHVACGGGDGEEASQPAAPTAPAGNRAPTISGSPPASALQDAQYSFAPNANDADGDGLTFSIQGLPPWASFDSSSGTLSGTPGLGDLGVYADIRISVSDGAVSANLAMFSIEVVATASGAVTLTWLSPTQNADGSPLDDLAGFRVYWGTSEGSYTNSVTLNNPGLTTYVVDQLTPATWYFVATALDASGLESVYSNSTSKTVL